MHIAGPPLPVYCQLFDSVPEIDLNYRGGSFCLATIDIINKYSLRNTGLRRAPGETGRL
jgi:hypothetical protein